MAQGLIAGATNYSEQSIMDIKSDIESWISYSINIKNFFEITILELKKQDYWDGKVAFDFQMFCYSVPRICDTFCSDFKIILDAINNDRITGREINLMRNIYQVSVENEEFSWKSFKGNGGEYRWHDYENCLFRKAEELYRKGRDFFVTLRDVSNMVSRMEDYMKEEKNIIDNSVHTDNSITIGDSNEIKSSVIGNKNTLESLSEKSSFWDKFGLPLLVTIIGGVIVAVICFFLNV